MTVVAVYLELPRLHLQPSMSEPKHSPLARFCSRYFLLNSQSIVQWNVGWINVKVLPLGFVTNNAEYSTIVNDPIVDREAIFCKSISSFQNQK